MPVLVFLGHGVWRLYFNAVVVLGTDPVHAARRRVILDDSRGHHSGAACRAGPLVASALIAKACTCRLRNFLCHRVSPPFPQNCKKRELSLFGFTCQEHSHFFLQAVVLWRDSWRLNRRLLIARTSQGLRP